MNNRISYADMLSRSGKIPSLDGLRAVSIGLVLLAHFVSAKIFPGGLGVFVFFIISGFLITRLLLAEHKASGRVDLAGFYMRRISRLYPVIIVFAAVVIGLDILLGRGFNFLEPLSGLAYFANYLYVSMETHGVNAQMPFGVFWSLSIEEHFYILFPVLFVAFRGDPRRLLLSMIALCVGCLALRLWMAHLHPEWLPTLTFYSLTHYRLDAIGFGVMLAVACESEQGRRVLIHLTKPVYFAAALATILVCLTLRDPWFRETWRYTVLGLAIQLIIIAVLFGDRYRVLQWVLNITILQWIGRLSYSLYIWHEGVSSFLPATLPTWQVALLSLTGSFMVASVSYYFIEQPFRYAILGRLRQHQTA